MKLLLIDIDGLRPDVFKTAMNAGSLPQLARLVGGTGFERGIQVPALATAPSITFCSQASLFTGAHPTQHGIPGNQFYDRFGSHSAGLPRHYAFDVGDTLAVDDAVLVFTKGLASGCLGVPTIYERFADWGWCSVVAGNMYAKGATHWIKPDLVDIARFTKGGNLFGMESVDYDRQILDQVIHHLAEDGLPEVLTFYFMGLDHESHLHGPGAQLDYLVGVVDPMIGELWDLIVRSNQGVSLPLVVIFSDHGQIQVIPDDRHSLRLAFPFEREIAHLFDALGLDVHDFPGEDPDCDAVVASNGGLAHVYIQNQTGRWADVPEFERDVLPIGGAFWEAHENGKYATELEGALAGVMIRNVESDGWYAPYQALTSGGEILSLDAWFSSEFQAKYFVGVQEYADPVHRLDNLVGPYVGDILLVSSYAGAFYFGGPTTGIHGGLHPEDSAATLAFGFPEAGAGRADQMRIAFLNAIGNRCQVENNRQPSTADLLTGLLAVLG